MNEEASGSGISTGRFSTGWYNDKKINEVVFCREFLREHPMICVKGSFFTRARFTPVSWASVTVL